MPPPPGATASGARVPLAALGVLALLAALAPWLAPYPPDVQLDLLALRTRPPSWPHPFGTDAYGRDVLSRVLHGARVSLAVSALAMVVGLATGAVVGVTAAAAGGTAERLVRRALEVALAIPRVLVLVVVAGFWGPLPAGTLVLVIGLTGWFDVARLVADETAALLGRDYVAAARAAGSGTPRILRRHLLPHLAPLLAALAPVALAATIAMEAGLGFLGLGIQPPQASWGTILQDGITAGPGAWWLTAFPGGAMLLVILAAHLAGERLEAPRAQRLRDGVPAPQVAPTPGAPTPAAPTPVAHPAPPLPPFRPSLAVTHAAPPLPLLAVDALRIAFPGARPEAPVRAVDGVAFTVGAGETVCLVGESGCGKSLTALACLGLVPEPGTIEAGSRVRFQGVDLLALPEHQRRALRGNRLALVFQEPMTALNPVLTVGDQVAEVVRVHGKASRREAWARAVAMLERVGVGDAAARARQYPHELSGGLCQRVLIAMALVMGPALLIADEPTTALDVTIQAQVLELLRTLRAESGMGVLLITHDLGVVAEMADRVVVMYAGRVVEEGPVGALFAAPAHPYTQGLLAAMPRLDTPEAPLAAIPGAVPAPGAWPSGCPFRDRCAHAMAVCATEEPSLRAVAPGHRARCHLVDQVAPA